MKTGITGVTMAAGNIKILKETFKSMATFCDEIIFGDLILFPEDRELLESYRGEFNLQIIKYPFDYIFANGFSPILNNLASYSSNDLVIYLNTSEVVERDNGILDAISPEYNCYFFDHHSDPMRWYRFYDRRDLRWSGRIHESLEPIGNKDFRPYFKPVFRMADMSKDMDNAFKSNVFDFTKEILYFHNYMSIIDDPKNLGATDPGWLRFAKDNYDSFKERLEKKGEGYKAFLNGDYYGFMEYAKTLDSKVQTFESNEGIEYQHDKKYLL